jgi:hypothetical protein
MKKIIYISCCLLLLTSCREYLDVNSDPNNPQSAPAYLLLPPMFANMVRGEAFDSRYVGKYVQYWSDVNANDTWDRHGYVAGSDAAGEKWRQHYWAIGKNVDLMIADATSRKDWSYVGAGKAIRAWSWQTSTDFHGDMILKEAWDDSRLSFDFDSQDLIYAEVTKLCNEALLEFAKTNGINTLSKGDLVYKGDTTKWVRFINGVLARNLNHLSNKSTYNPDKIIALVDKSFTSNSDNFSVPHDGTNSDNSNFFGPLRSNMANFRPSVFVISLLDGTSLGAADPRLPLMFTASPDGVYRGVQPTLGDPNNTTGNTKRIPTLWGTLPGVTVIPGKFLFTNKAPHALMTYFELQFIKAEAAFKKGDKAVALDAYTKGIAASLDFVGVAVADKNTYLASNAVKKTTGTLTLNDIMLQKYIALYGHGCLETWVDLRRYQYSSSVYTGFALPAAVSLFPDNNGKPAQRARPRYNSEYVWNRASLDKIGGNNLDYHTYEMWFSKP